MKAAELNLDRQSMGGLEISVVQIDLSCLSLPKMDVAAVGMRSMYGPRLGWLVLSI